MFGQILQKMLVAAFLLIPAVARAGILTERNAREIAADFFRAGNDRRLAEPDALTLAHIEYEASAPVYYVFNALDGKGFIIISADEDASVPVVGYSCSSSWHADMIPDATDMLRVNVGLRDKTSFRKAPGLVPRSGGRLLSTPVWSQEAPFNNRIPNRRLTGCVGIALAEILKYHQYPANRPASLVNDGDPVSYSWDIMRDDNYRGGYSADEADAVAVLVSDAAVSIDTDFGMSSSSAFEVKVPAALVEFFGYDAGVSYKKGSEMDRDSWDAVIVNEIDEGRPVLYSGQDVSAGHAFVCDGYEFRGETAYFHINWGWGGSADGYYASDALCPSVSMSHNFNDMTTIVYNIKPASASVEWSPIHLTSDECQAGMTLDVTDLEPGLNFTVRAGALKNITGRGFSGSISVGLFSADGTMKTLLAGEKGFGLGSLQIVRYTDFSCTVPSDASIADGDVVRLVTKDKESGSWLPVPNDLLTAGALPAKGNVIPYVDIRIPSSEDGVEITYADTRVIKGRDFSFKVVSTSAEKVVTVKANGFILTPGSDSGYRINNVMSNQEVSVIVQNASDVVSKRNLWVQAGTLSSLIDDKDCGTITDLTLYGTIDARDFTFMRDRMKLTRLDISGVSVVANGSNPANAIPANAFNGYWSLNQIILPGNINTFKNGCFRSSGLKSIEIPASVSTYEYNVFVGCSGLSEVIVRRSSPAWVNWCVFNGTPKARLVVPVGALAAYESKEYWKDFREKIEENPVPPTHFSVITQETPQVRFVPVAESSQVEPGASYEFKVETVESYGDATLEIYANNTRLYPGQSGVYTCTVNANTLIHANFRQPEEPSFESSWKITGAAGGAGLVTDVVNVSKGKSFRIRANALAIPSDDAVMYYCAALTDSEGRIKELISPVISNSSFNFGNLPCDFVCQVKDADVREGNLIRIVTSYNKKRWNPVKADSDTISDCISAVGNRVVYHDINMPQKVEGAVIDGFADRVVRGMPFSIKVMPVSVDDRITVAVNGINKIVDAAIGSLSLPAVLEDLDISIQVNPKGENAYTVVNVREGELEAKIEQCPSRLKVIGTMRSEDFAAFRRHAGTIVDLDLADVTIKGAMDLANAIPSDAFASPDAGVSTSLKSIVLPAGLVNIEENAFARCSGITEITLPASVAYVGSGAFSSCIALRKIVACGTQPPATGNMSPFPTDSGSITLEVPAGSESYYSSASYWSDLGQTTSVKYYNIQIDPERTFNYNEYYTLTKIDVSGGAARVTIGLPNFKPLTSKKNPTYRPGVPFRLYDNDKDVTTTSSYVCYGQHSVVLDPDYQPESIRYPRDHEIKVVFHYPFDIHCGNGLETEFVDLIEDNVWRGADMSLFVEGSTEKRDLFREGEDYRFRIMSEINGTEPKVRCVSHNVTSFGDNPQFADVETTLVPDENGVYTVSNLQGKVDIYVTAELVVNNGMVVSSDDIPLVSDEDASLLTDIGVRGDIGEETFRAIREKFISLETLDMSEMTNESIPDNAFSDMESLKSVVVPESLKSIGSRAFAGCTSLESITLPGVTSIGDSAFDGCMSMTSVSILGQSGGEVASVEGMKAPAVAGISESSFLGMNPNCLVYLPDGFETLAGSVPNVIVNRNGSRVAVADMVLSGEYPFCAPASFSLADHSVSLEFNIPGSVSDDNDLWKGIVVPFMPTSVEYGKEFSPRGENPLTLMSFADAADTALSVCDVIEANRPYLASVCAPFDTIPVRFVAKGKTADGELVYDVPFTPSPEEIRADGKDFCLYGSFDGSGVDGQVYMLDDKGMVFRKISDSSASEAVPFGTYLRAVGLSASDEFSIGLHPVWVHDPVSTRKSGESLYRSSLVDLSSATPGAEVYYTLDGTDPVSEGMKYTSPFALPGDSVSVKAVALFKDYRSDVVILDYELMKTELDYTLGEGWSWISHNVETELPLSDFMTDGIIRVLSQTQEVIRDPSLGLVGSLETLVPLAAYKVFAGENAAGVSLGGISYDPSVPVSLVKGWNWIGCPLDRGVISVSDAFVGLEAGQGDMIVGRDGFAQVDADGNWIGTLSELRAGCGYMYFSGADKEFVYNTQPSGDESSENVVMRNYGGWTVDSHRYPSVMPVICRVSRNGIAVGCDEYDVVAFCGDECRGVGVMVDDWIMVSVFGDAGDEIDFRLCSRETHEEQLLSRKLVFTENPVGSLDAPYVFDSTVTSVGSVSDGSYSVAFENGALIVGGDISGILSVDVYDVSGAVISSESVSGNDRICLGQYVPGVYIVVVHTVNGRIGHKVEVR